MMGVDSKGLHPDLSTESYEFITRYCNPEADKTEILKVITPYALRHKGVGDFETIVNLNKINDIRFVNKFQEQVNESLVEGGIYIGLVETQEQRSRRLLNKYIPVFAHVYLFFDFIFKRVFPKLPYLKKLYFFITDGRNRVMSKAEALGRLVSCGFRIVELKEINNRLWFVAKKVAAPVYDLNPSYGPLFAMKRIGKDGQIIQVYKFRTMYPYAEYLQEYVYETQQLAEGGKFANDFRITTWGKIIRRCWLDELPMIINLFKGELKIVGVRPLSRHYFSLYSKELQDKRIDSKPGLLPPFYVDMPKTLEEIIESEMRYLRMYEKSPLLTDIRYFCSIFYSIIVRRARSN